jgi:protocatechuate 3,4-dioxygenase beta subunit
LLIRECGSPNEGYNWAPFWEVPVKQTRRELLERCVAMGAMTLATSTSLSFVALAWDGAERKRNPTPLCELGPFYKRGAPQIANMHAAGEPGMPLSVSGSVYSANGEILPNAKVEIWQTDHFGKYDLQGYKFRATLQPDPKGQYEFESVMPGHYPARVCQHVHYLITAPGHKPLTTQLYFGTDPVFEGDPDKNFSRDPLITSRELVRPVMLKGDPQQIIARVNFDIVLARA